MTERSCGTCTICCKVVEVEALEKPAGKWCVHARPGKGCAIWGSHPDDCRNYRCGWLLQPELDETWKPERCGFVLAPGMDGRRIGVLVDPNKPDAWRRAPFYQVIKGWARRAWANDGDVFVHIGRRAIAIFPEEDIDVGDFLPGDTLVAGYQIAPHFRRPLVRHTTAAGVQRELMGKLYPSGR